MLDSDSKMQAMKAIMDYADEQEGNMLKKKKGVPDDDIDETLGNVDDGNEEKSSGGLSSFMSKLGLGG